MQRAPAHLPHLLLLLLVSHTHTHTYNTHTYTHRGTWFGASPPEGYAQLAGDEAEAMEAGKDDKELSWVTLFWGK